MLNPGHTYVTLAPAFCVTFDIYQIPQPVTFVYYMSQTCLLHVYDAFLESANDLLINTSLSVFHLRW